MQVLTCASCGAALPCDVQEAAVTCRFCGTDNHIEGDDLPLAYHLEPVLESREAVRVVRAETSVAAVSEGFSRDLRVERTDLVFLPFNAIRASRAGRAVAVRERRSALPGTPGPIENGEAPEVDTRIVLGEILLDEPACDAAGLGAHLVRFEQNVFGRQGHPLLPYARDRVASLGMVLDPERHPRTLRSRLEVAGTDGPGRRIEAVGVQLMRVFYPVWAIRCVYAGRSHTFVVDALDGTVLTGRVPPSRRHAALATAASLFAAVVPLALACRAAVWWVSPSGGGAVEIGGIVTFGIASGLLASLAWGVSVMGLVTASLRRGRELVFRGGTLGEDVVNLPARDPVERLGLGILDLVDRMLAAGAEASRHG